MLSKNSTQDIVKLRYAETGLRSEWPSGLKSFRQVPEVKLGRVRSDSGWVLGGLTSHLTLSSFGREIKLGVPCFSNMACMVNLN